MSPSWTRVLPWSPALSQGGEETPQAHRFSCSQEGLPSLQSNGDASGGRGAERASGCGGWGSEGSPPVPEATVPFAQEARPWHLWLTAMLIGVSFPLDSLLAGIPQKVKFIVTTGHYTVKNGDSLQLSNVEAMLILCHADNRAVIYSNTRGEAAVRWLG